MGRGAAASLDFAPKTTFVSLQGADLHHYVDLDYDEDRNCEEEGCDSICRCSTISNARVRSLSVSSLVGYLAPDADPITVWALEQALTMAGVQEVDESDWDIDVTWGYYGQEIGKVSVSHEAAEKIEEIAQALLSIPEPQDRLFHILEEKGVNTKKLKAKRMIIEIVPKASLKDPVTPLPKGSSDYRYISPLAPHVIAIRKAKKLEVLDGADQLPLLGDRFRAIVFSDPAQADEKRKLEITKAKQKAIPLLSLLGQRTGGLDLDLTFNHYGWQSDYYVCPETDLFMAHFDKRISTTLESLARDAGIETAPGKGLGTLDAALKALADSVKPEGKKYSSKRPKDHRITISVSASGNYKLKLDKGQSIALGKTSERKAAKAALLAALA
jgi:hypothetical protein